MNLHPSPQLPCEPQLFAVAHLLTITATQPFRDETFYDAAFPTRFRCRRLSG
jgi:hypothetical protein